MTDPARQSFLVTRHAYDARADYHRRIIHMSLSQVTIERVVEGIAMCVAVPVASYRALKIRIQAPRGTATLTLSHSDADLDVVLASGKAVEVTIAGKAWASVLEKQLVAEAGASMLPTIPRRTKKATPSRRSSFSRRRATGQPDRMTTCFRGEDEIIARN